VGRPKQRVAQSRDGREVSGAVTRRPRWLARSSLSAPAGRPSATPVAVLPQHLPSRCWAAGPPAAADTP
jgi:hypothetical protein